MESKGPDKTFQIGDWRLIPALNLLEGKGREVRLEPRHADLLVFLAERSGEVVSAEAILANVWGGLVVGDHSLYQAIAKLRRALGDDASQASYIETVPKRGYRLIAEVRTLAAPMAEPMPDLREMVVATAAPTTNPPGMVPSTRRAPLSWVLVGLALLGLFLVLAWRVQPPSEGPAADVSPSLAVLPFASLSREPSDAFIAEGFAIELANLLAPMDGVRILGPVSVKLAAENATEPGEIGRRLDANLLVSGTLRRASSQLRISAALTDVRSGLQLWSRIFERDDGDIFELQRGIATEIARELEDHLALDPGTLTSPNPPDSQKAYEDFLLGQYYRSIRSGATLERAAGLFRHSLGIDPHFSAARRNLATTYLLLSFYGDRSLLEALEQAEPLLKQCLGESPDNAEVLGAIGLSHYLQGSYGLAEEYLRRAVDRAPNYVEGWMWLGLAERQQGRLRDALEAFAHARGLEPLMVTAAINHANALLWSGDPSEARQGLEDLTATVRNHPQLERVLSNVALESGDLVGAYRWASEALAIEPDDVPSRVNMAMVLTYLGQAAAAAAMITDTRSAARHGRAAQLYLDRLALTAPSLRPRDTDQVYDAQLWDSPNVPEIEWRLANARIGLIDYFSGSLDSAHERLSRSLTGRVDPIERTDYDLFLCTSLADAEQRLGKAMAASRWLSRCESDLAEAKRQGWRSVALIYVEARLAMLRHRASEALQILETLRGQGFRNSLLLGADPIFIPIQDEAAFSRLRASLDQQIQEAWRQVATKSGCAEPDPPGCDRTDR